MPFQQTYHQRRILQLRNRFVGLLVIVFAVCLFGFSDVSNVAAQAQQDELEFPTAQEIIEKYVHAMGGFEVLSSRHNLHCISSGYSSHGSTFEYEVYQAEGEFRSRFEFNDGRVLERGISTDGKIDADGVRIGHAWEISSGNFREITSKEKQEYLRRRSSVTSVARLFEYYDSIEFSSSEAIDGREVFKLILTDHDGKKFERYFDAKSGLLRRQICIEALADRQLRVTRDYLNYEQVGELTISMKQVVTHEDGSEWVYEIELYEVDKNIPRTTFKLPQGMVAAIAKAEAVKKAKAADKEAADKKAAEEAVAQSGEAQEDD